MSNKEKFLKENVGFHFEDLSLMRRIELEQIMNELKVSTDWILLALSRDTLENWEKWGFALFKKPDFRTTINNLEQEINSMSEENFKQENNRKNQKKPHLWVDEKTFYRAWNMVKAQGGLLTDEEAEARNLSTYYKYNPAIEDTTAIDMLLAQDDLTDGDDRVVFMIGVKRVEVIELTM